MNKIEEILNFYEMTGSYIGGAKRHEYKHYDKLSKQNIVRELTTLIENREKKAVKGFIENLECRTIYDVDELLGEAEQYLRKDVEEYTGSIGTGDGSKT